MSTIQVRDLTKRYGDKKGVFGLTFEVNEGEVFGYLGPNGSGKTTTIRHLMGFLNPDRGSCRVGGLDCRREAAAIQQGVGYLPGEIAFFEDMKGTEYLRFLSSLRGRKWAPRADELLAHFELDPSGHIKRMSKGMKQKLALVAAFMHDPDTLILDEPTSGLDPLMQNAFVKLVRSEKQRGKTMLLSSHSFDEIERTSDRVGILRDGSLQALLGVRELTHQRRRQYAVLFDELTEQAAFAAEGLELVEQTPGRVVVAVTGSLSPFTQALAKHRITGLDTLSQGLEDIFISYYGGQAHDRRIV